MLDFKIYKYPMFALSSVISIVLSVAMFSGMILTPLYVQKFAGFRRLIRVFLCFRVRLLWGSCRRLRVGLFDKYGAKVLAIIGLVITIVTTYYLSKLGMDSGYYYIMFIYTVRMFGISMVMMPIMTNGLNQLPMISNPHGTAMNNTLQQVSGAIGSAILLTIMTKRMETSGACLADVAASIRECTINDKRPWQHSSNKLKCKQCLMVFNFRFSFRRSLRCCFGVNIFRETGYAAKF